MTAGAAPASVRPVRTPRPGVLVGLVLACLLAVATGPVVAGGRTWGPLTRDSLSVVAAFLAIACAAYAAVRGRGALRRSWSLLCLMLVMNAVGASAWLAEGGSQAARDLSASDVLYLGALVPSVVALVGYPTAKGLVHAWRPLAVDALVLASSLLLLVAVVVLSPVARSLDGTRAVLYLAYPAADAVVISIMAVLLLRSTGRWRADVLLLLATFVAFAVGDTAFALDGARGEGVGAVAQLGYAAAALLFTLAALASVSLSTQRRVLERHLGGRVGPVLPDAAALVALAVLLLHGVDDDLQRTLAVVVLALTTVRRATLTGQNLALRRDLEGRVCARTEELRQLTEQHRRLDAMKSEFVSAVSHELRTPLTAIRGSLELLADGDLGPCRPRRCRRSRWPRAAASGSRAWSTTSSTSSAWRAAASGSARARTTSPRSSTRRSSPCGSWPRSPAWPSWSSRPRCRCSATPTG